MSRDEARVSVRILDLIVGRPLLAPIYDLAGVLLLAEGSLVTPEFKRLLQSRGDAAIGIAASCADSISYRRDSTEVPRNEAPDHELAHRLDQLVDSGSMFVQNIGPALNQCVVHHGRMPRNEENLERLRQHRDAVCESLSGMIKEALHGREGDVPVLTWMTSETLAELIEDSDGVLDTVLDASRDEELSRHCVRMSTLGMAIAMEMGLDVGNCRSVGLAGLVHDWAMIRVPTEIRKQSPLLPESELLDIKKHPIWALELLERLPGLPSIVPIIAYQVHERTNGTGYPRGRTGERIHLLARILAVADVYSALTETRPYRPKLSRYAAMECVIRMARRRDLDADVVRAFLNVMCLFPIGSYVVLDDGSLARVIRRNGDHYAKPIVQVLQTADGRNVASNDDIVDLFASRRQVIHAISTPGEHEEIEVEKFVTLARPIHATKSGEAASELPVTAANR